MRRIVKAKNTLTYSVTNLAIETLPPFLTPYPIIILYSEFACKHLLQSLLNHPSGTTTAFHNSLLNNFFCTLQRLQYTYLSRSTNYARLFINYSRIIPEIVIRYPMNESLKSITSPDPIPFARKETAFCSTRNV